MFCWSGQFTIDYLTIKTFMMYDVFFIILFGIIWQYLALWVSIQTRQPQGYRWWILHSEKILFFGERMQKRNFVFKTWHCGIEKTFYSPMLLRRTFSTYVIFRGFSSVINSNKCHPSETRARKIQIFVKHTTSLEAGASWIFIKQLGNKIFGNLVL